MRQAGVSLKSVSDRGGEAVRLWGVLARVVLWGCGLASGLLAGEQGILIADFDGANPLAGWRFSRDSEFPGADGSLGVGPGHTGQGAMLEYRFVCAGGSRCGGAVSAVWTPARPVSVKRSAALSLWIRAKAEVRITLLVRDKTEETRRYMFETTTLEHPGGEDWRQVVLPLASKGADENHSLAPKGRIRAIGILVEARYPQPMRGSVTFDDVRLLDSPDRSFALKAALPLRPAPPGSAQLAPRLGVNTHSRTDEHMLDMARQAGFSFVRADLFWQRVERNGQYRFGAYDRLWNALQARGMGALFILDYGHSQHGGSPPRSSEDVSAFVRYAEAAAAHFKGRNVRYEVWNEPNTEEFWPPHPDAEGYAAMLRETAAAIHRTDPAASVASGGVSGIDLPFLEGMIAAGGTSGVSAVAVHPYRQMGPETLAADLPLLRQLLNLA